MFFDYFHTALNFIRMCFPFPGRRVFPAIIVSLSLFACHQPDHSVKKPESRRMALIAALKELRGRMLSGDKTQIASLFNFPLPDSVFNVYVDDSIFQQEYTKHDYALTRQMFNTYFEKLGAGLPSFGPLFSLLNPDSLLTKDTIEDADITDTLPYFDDYSIIIENDSLVSIRFSTGPNSNFVPPKKAKDTVSSRKDTAGVRMDSSGVKVDTAGGTADTTSITEDEEDPSEYEHATGWEFVFDGKKLRFIREYQAD
jgi:hypothetical protein